MERLVIDGRVFLDAVPPPPAAPVKGKTVAEPAVAYAAVPAVYLAPFYHSEVGVAQRLATLYHSRTASALAGLAEKMEQFAPQSLAKLSPEQRQQTLAAIGAEAERTLRPVLGNSYQKFREDYAGWLKSFQPPPPKK